MAEPETTVEREARKLLRRAIRSRRRLAAANPAELDTALRLQLQSMLRAWDEVIIQLRNAIDDAERVAAIHLVGDLVRPFAEMGDEPPALTLH
jgi:hypothetical protein